MGLDASIERINYKINSDLEYDKIRQQKWIEFNEDIQKFTNWEDNVCREILYTSDWDVANIINSKNIISKTVDFQKNRHLVLNKEDIEDILKIMKLRNNKYNKYICQLENCLKTTDFKRQSLLYGEWF